MYKKWLFYTCKWSTIGLDGNEFTDWQELTTKLDKHCPDCVEGYICESCKNNGLKLNDLEKMIVGNIDKLLDLHRADKIN